VIQRTLPFKKIVDTGETGMLVRALLFRNISVLKLTSRNHLSATHDLTQSTFSNFGRLMLTCGSIA
jgi:hypothetical protein